MIVVTASGTTTSGKTVSAASELYLTPFRDMSLPLSKALVNVTLSGQRMVKSEVSPESTQERHDVAMVTLTISSDSMVPLLTLNAPDVGGSAVGGYFSDNGFLAVPGHPVTVSIALAASQHPTHSSLLFF